MYILNLFRGWFLVVKAYSDYETNEFHITPVLTYTWSGILGLSGYAIAIEWGFWTAYIGISKLL